MSNEKPADNKSQSTPVRKTLAKSKKIKRTDQMTKPVGGVSLVNVQVTSFKQPPKPAQQP